MYKVDSKVKYSDVGENGSLTIPSLIQYFQDCYIDHGESIGQGIGSLNGSEKVWVLGFWQIIIRKRPYMNELFSTNTLSYEVKEFFDRRNFILYNQKEELCAFANSIWLYVDTKRKRPVKYNISNGEDAHVESPFPMKKCDRKILFPNDGGNWEIGEPHKIKRSSIDTNSHVNNCEYVKIAIDNLPDCFDESKIRQLRVEYKKPAELGNILIPHYFFDEGKGILYMELRGEKEEVYTSLLFSYHEWIGDEE